MLPLLTPDPNPLAEFRRMGIAASLAWAADDEYAALVFVFADGENVARLERWVRSERRINRPRGIEA